MFEIQNTYVIGVFFALMATCMWATSNIIDEIIIKHKNVPTHNRQYIDAILWVIFGILGLLISPVVLSIHLLLSFVSGVCLISSNYLYYHALKRSKAEIVASHFPIFFLFSMFLGIFLNSDPITLKRILGCFLVFTAATCSSVFMYSDSSIKRGNYMLKNMSLMVPASFLLALNYIFSDIAVDNIGILSTYSGALTGGALFFIIFSVVKGKKLPLANIKTRSIIVAIFVSETCNLIGIFLITTAYFFSTSVIASSVTTFQPIYIYFVFNYLRKIEALETSSQIIDLKILLIVVFFQFIGIYFIVDGRGI